MIKAINNVAAVPARKPFLKKSHALHESLVVVSLVATVVGDSVLFDTLVVLCVGVGRVIFKVLFVVTVVVVVG